MAVSLSLSVNIRGREYQIGDLYTAVAEHAASYSLEQANGTVDNLQDLIWSDARSLVATSETLDLNNSLNPAVQANLISLVEVRGIYIRNKATVAASKLVIGNAASPAYAGLFGGAAHTISVPAGGMFLWTAPLDGYGLVVTGTSADGLKVDAGAATIPYEIIVWGVSA